MLVGGTGVGVDGSSGVGAGIEVGTGIALGDAVGVGDGVGLGDGVTVGVGDDVGVGVGSTVGSGVAVAGVLVGVGTAVGSGTVVGTIVGVGEAEIVGRRVAVAGTGVAVAGMTVGSISTVGVPSDSKLTVAVGLGGIGVLTMLAAVGLATGDGVASTRICVGDGEGVGSVPRQADIRTTNNSKMATAAIDVLLIARNFMSQSIMSVNVRRGI